MDNIGSSVDVGRNSRTYIRVILIDGGSTGWTGVVLRSFSSESWSIMLIYM